MTQNMRNTAVKYSFFCFSTAISRYIESELAQRVMRCAASLWSLAYGIQGILEAPLGHTQSPLIN